MAAWPFSPHASAIFEAAISTITKTYGDGSIMRLGDARAKVGIEVIPTGALGLDLALGVGGIPRGRVVEIYGPESSGKTTLMLHVIANAQKMGGLSRHSLTPSTYWIPPTPRSSELIWMTCSLRSRTAAKKR